MLRFYARPGHVLSWPGVKHAGQFARYVGRTTKVERDAAGAVVSIGHPAVAEAVEVDPDSGDKVQRERALRLVRLMRIEVEKPLWAADEATANACGVKFVPVELVDGEWHQKFFAFQGEPEKAPEKPKTTSSKEASQ